MSAATAATVLAPPGADLVLTHDTRSAVPTTVAVVEPRTQPADGAPPEVRFVAPLLGLEHLDAFALAEVDPQSPLLSLRSLQDEGVRLLVVDPADVVVGYEPGFDAVARAAVGLRGDEPGRVLVVVSPGDSLATSSVNLLAPLLLNPATGAAAQVVLTGSEHPLRQPLG